MPPQEAEKKSNDTATHRTSAGSRSFKDAFSIPWPIKALFDKVPLLTYPPNELPKRGKRQAGLPSLYVFATESQAAKGRPSFNPSCLKWQVSQLHLCGESSLTGMADLPEDYRHRLSTCLV